MKLTSEISAWFDRKRMKAVLLKFDVSSPDVFTIIFPTEKSFELIKFNIQNCVKVSEKVMKIFDWS